MIGRSIYKFNEISSTNDYIKDNITTLKHGDVIISKTQSKGRGRFGNSWNSPEGNLYFSYLINKKVARDQIFNYHMSVSLAIIETLNEIGIQAFIKYPNDIMVDGKKIAGILIETIGYDQITNLVIGLGINVNQVDFNELDNKAISTKIISKKQTDLDLITQILIKNLNSLNNKENIYKKYLNKVKFKNRYYTYNDEIYEIKTITIDGKLHLESKNKNIYLNYDNISLSHLYE